MSDRDPSAPGDGTSELPPTEPVESGSNLTEPIDPDEPTPPPPPGGYATLRRAGSGIPGGLIVAAVVVLLVGFVPGYFLGRSTAPDQAPPPEQVEPGDGGGGGQGGGGNAARRQRRACRRAVDLGAQLIELQRQTLANQTALTEAVIAEDAERIEVLIAAGEQLQGQMAGVQGQLDQASQRCRPG
ncbi:MAG: hypothetical protein ACRD02_14560 [Acidimicrobiia bacterium]